MKWFEQTNNIQFYFYHFIFNDILIDILDLCTTFEGIFTYYYYYYGHKII